jgi:hypothetical protein
MNNQSNDLQDYKPCAREHDVVVQELLDEVLVYDMTKKKAHCLNGSAAAVWGLCDGQTRIPELAGQLENRMAKSVNEEMVWIALEHLGEAGLLTAPVPVRAVRGGTRRQLLQKLAYAAVAIPLVSSISAPLPSAAASGFCANAACLACTDLASSAICAFAGPASCGSCAGTCCRGGADCTTCTGGGPVLETCDSCKFGVIAAGDPACPLSLGVSFCSCDSTRAGAGFHIYPACSWASV